MNRNCIDFLLRIWEVIRGLLVFCTASSSIFQSVTLLIVVTRKRERGERERERGEKERSGLNLNGTVLISILINNGIRTLYRFISGFSIVTTTLSFPPPSPFLLLSYLPDKRLERYRSNSKAKIAFGIFVVENVKFSCSCE
jgi:hypothetical protein